MNKEDNYTPTVIHEFCVDMTNAAVIKHSKAGLYYEVGIELPMDLGNVNNLDTTKICNLLDIKGMPICVDLKASEIYGCLENKPALFVMTNDINEADVIDWAKECANKMADFDFADYYIVHDGYDELTKDEPMDWIKDQSYNIDSGEWEEER